jgi:hypothetical protein
MLPLPDRVRRYWARFQYDRGHAALKYMGGGRKPNRAAAYDRDCFAWFMLFSY